MLAIPGLGPLIAAGPIVSALAGAGAAGLVGGVVGSLAGMGIPEYEAKRYEGRVKRGSILLSVHCDSNDWVKRAEGIFKQTGAEDIASSVEAPADFGKSDEINAGTCMPSRETGMNLTRPPASMKKPARRRAQPATPAIFEV